MKLIKEYILLVIAIFFFQRANAQATIGCDSNYFSFLYNADNFCTYSKASTTDDNTTIALQSNRLYFNGLTKFTAQGNVIFSYDYTAPYIANGYHSWTDLVFKDMSIASNSYVYTCGSVTKHGVFFDNTEVPPARTAGVICKIDKYGKVIWSKFIANSTPDPLEVNKILTLSNGDVIGYLTTDVQMPYYARLVCLNSEGNVKWLRTLNTGIYTSGSMKLSNRALTQARNGNIVLADVVTHYDSAMLYPNGEYHFIAFDQSTGSVVWETSYGYDDTQFIPNINSIYELPNGDLSIQTMRSSPVSQSLNIITDSKGNIKKMIATHPVDDYIITIGTNPDGNNGEQTLLMQASDGNAALTRFDKDGNILWSRKYGQQDASVPPTCFSKINDGYNVILSELSRSFRMLRTDPIGRLDCDSTTITLMQETVSPFRGNINNIRTKDTLALNLSQTFNGGFVVQNTEVTSIQRSTVCQKNIPCCVDVVDTNHVNTVDMCEGKSYTLPDKTVVQDSGKYYVSYKTQKGCDSVSLYQINVYKNPAGLSLGLDTCFNGADTIALHATDGYNQYVWSNDLITSLPYYTVKDSGIYTVTVSNICGTKTDSIHVYEQCDFPVYMPNAFTPNGDRLNDVYKVPSVNLNRLLLFTIYNRWGKIIFQTRDINKGWDGNVSSLPQAPGIYIYSLNMTNLIGKPVNQHGTFMLIR